MDELAAYERRFRRAGLPLFIAGYSAREDVWTRVAPVLSLVLLAEVLGAVDLDWPLLANLGALTGGLAILAGSFALANRLRGRSAFALPDDIGAPELAAFVLVPGLLPLIFGGQTTSAWVTSASNLALLGVLYLVIGYGVPSILVWALRRLGLQLATAAQLLARAVPLLLLFAVVLFLTAEVWQVFGELREGRLAAVGGLLLGVGVLFLAVRVPQEVRSLEAGIGSSSAAPPLDRRQRFNVGLVLFASQALQVVVVGVAIAVFFVAFGMLAINTGVIEAWTGRPVQDVATVAGVTITRELLRVAAMIAAFSGVYYAIAVLTDRTYRAEFLDELTDELRASFADRAEYLRLRQAAQA